jgi:polyribonucleotide nucleotidyltransferase
MFKIVRKEIVWGGKKLSIESGKIARQADGAVILTSGDTVILATVVGAKKAKPDIDFFPLTVNYQEKYYAGFQSSPRSHLTPRADSKVQHVLGFG